MASKRTLLALMASREAARVESAEAGSLLEDDIRARVVRLARKRRKTGVRIDEGATLPPRGPG